MKRLFAGFSLLLFCSTALAEFPVGKVGVRVSPMVDVEMDGAGDGDGSAFGFRGELGGDMLFGYADHQANDLEINNVDFDLDETRFGIGVRGGNSTGSIHARVEFYDVSMTVNANESNDEGMGAHLGAELPFGDSVAAFASFGFLSLDDSDGSEYQIGVRGNLSPAAELFAGFRGLTLEDDLTSKELELRDFRIGVNLLF